MSGCCQKSKCVQCLSSFLNYERSALATTTTLPRLGTEIFLLFCRICHLTTKAEKAERSTGAQTSKWVDAHPTGPWWWRPSFPCWVQEVGAAGAGGQNQLWTLCFHSSFSSPCSISRGKTSLTFPCSIFLLKNLELWAGLSQIIPLCTLLRDCSAWSPFVLCIKV